MLAEDKASHLGLGGRGGNSLLQKIGYTVCLPLTLHLFHSNYLCSEKEGTWPTRILQIKWLSERGLSSRQTQWTSPSWLRSPHLITCTASSALAPGGSPLKRSLLSAKEKAAGP